LEFFVKIDEHIILQRNEANFQEIETENILQNITLIEETLSKATTNKESTSNIIANITLDEQSEDTTAFNQISQPKIDIYDPLQSPVIETKSVEKSMNPRFRTSFYNKEFVQFVEGTNIEYKNYYLPFTPTIEFNLKKQISAFLNANGGRIYLGINDNKIVYGMRLTPKERDFLKVEIQSNYLRNFYPDCRQFIQIHYVPVKEETTKKYLKNSYVVKIIVRQGEPDRLYRCEKTSFKAFIRLDGLSATLDAQRIEEEIVKRKESPRKRANLDDFIDPEPEQPFESKEHEVFYNYNYYNNYGGQYVIRER